MPSILRLFRNSSISDEEYEKRISDFQLMLTKTNQKPGSLNGESVTSDYYDLLDKTAVRVMKSHLPVYANLEEINFSLPAAVMQEVSRARSLGIFRPDCFQVRVTRGDDGEARVHAGVVIAFGPDGNDGAFRNKYLIAAWGDEAHLDKMAVEFKDSEAGASRSGGLKWGRTLLAGLIMAFVGGAVAYPHLKEKFSTKKVVSINPDFAQLAQKACFSWLNPDITASNFPDIGVSVEPFEIYSFPRAVSFNEVVREMEKRGYQPANLRELLVYSQGVPDSKDSVYALGQSWRDKWGYLRFPNAWYGEGRAVHLVWDNDWWHEGSKFLAVRKPSAEAAH